MLDALAIAGQVMVGRALGAGDAPEACAAAAPDVELSFAAGLLIGAVLLALSGVIPRAFTSDADVLDQRATLWPLFALHAPVRPRSSSRSTASSSAPATRATSPAAMAVAPFVRLPADRCSSTGASPASGRRSTSLMVVRLATMAARFAGRAGPSSARS